MPIATLSKGYKKPSNPTTGDLWFPAMEDNIQLMNDHVHDGATGTFTPADTATVSSGSWGSDLGGSSYRQTITVPDSRNYDDVRIEVRDSTGVMCYPTIEKINATTFYIYTNDNSKSYTISYV